MSDQRDEHDPTRTVFRELGLDPWQTPQELTDTMRELAEDADPEERRRLQGLWRKLTLDRSDYLNQAVFSHRRPDRPLRDIASMSTDELRRTFRFPGIQDVSEDQLAAIWARLDETPSPADLAILPPIDLLPSTDKGDATDVPADEDPLLRL